MKLHIKMAEQRISQRELAQLTGIRQPSISAYCTDSFKMIPKEHIDIFCKFFNCKIEDLIEYVQEEKAEG
ncbi:DNA-binding helix-turn-helix protein [Clostridiales bacterium oral taxon 876 str. F0540]|nr:DNA-binding helix-turn-helix protein [Clostridiales bacterium oral taxon 876 str. F0540]